MKPMVNRCVISVVGCALSVQVMAEEPGSVGLENMAELLRGDVRLIAMGDSYSAPFYARVPLAGLRVWPIENISALCSGAPMSSHMFICTAQCNPVALIQSSDKFGYTVERNSADSYFALPLRGIREIYTSTTFDDEGSNQLFEFRMNSEGLDHLSNGVHGRFAELGDDVMFRFLYRCPSDRSTQVEKMKLLDYGEEVGIMHLRDGARPLWHLGEDPTAGSRLAVPEHINAAADDYPARNNTDGFLKMRLEQVESLVGTHQYFEPAGCVYYHIDADGNRKHGLYYSHVSDDSWSYAGFGCDTQGTGIYDKKFSLEQFTHWLDVTTLDRNQPTVFLWYFAPEQVNYDSAKELMTNMINQADQASELVGLTSVQHLIVIAHLYNMSGDEDQDRQTIVDQQNAAFDLASSEQSISAASIYTATDGTMFSGATAIPWLLYHGFDAFEFGSNNFNLVQFSLGDLLDTSNVHPKNPESAAFFASVLGEMIRESGCPADVVVDGFIDVRDILAVIDHMGDTFAHEDINNDGVVDIVDLLLVVDTWGECWPVQSPFNTVNFRAR